MSHEGTTLADVYDDVREKEHTYPSLTYDTLQVIHVYINWSEAKLGTRRPPVSAELHLLTQGGYGSCQRPSTVAGVTLTKSRKGPQQIDNRPTLDQPQAAKSMEEGIARSEGTLRELRQRIREEERKRWRNHETRERMHNEERATIAERHKLFLSVCHNYACPAQQITMIYLDMKRPDSNDMRCGVSRK